MVARDVMDDSDALDTQGIEEPSQLAFPGLGTPSDQSKHRTTFEDAEW